jgi:serine/threonine-protein kinase
LIEGVLFATFAVTCAGYTWTAARIQVSYPAPIGGVLANSQILFWFACIMTYGFLVPNTARRCLAVVSGMVLAAVASMLSSWFSCGISPAGLSGAVPNLILWMGIAVAITVTGAHWSDRLRRQAQEARRLGQYVLRRQLGAGGMGEVYLAEHVLLKRPAAIKLIRPDRAGDPKNLQRFEREVKTTATLTHPNTVQVFDYGHTEDGTFYYVMEYLPGLTLDSLVKDAGPLPPARAVHFLRQLCGALAEAHGAGLVHRDIKPGNVMVCERGGARDVVKLLDFGLVLPHGVGDEKLTQDGAVAGTPAYMSPEQASGRDEPGARSDIYSVGALAYFLLAGRSPFAGRAPVQVLAAHLYETPEPPSRHRPEVPADLEAVVLHCLAKNPLDRFPDAESLDAALAQCEAAGRWTAKEAAAWWLAQTAGESGEASSDQCRATVTHGPA